MLRIAICDDDSATVQANRKIAEDCLKQCGSAGEIATYTHSDNLLYGAGGRLRGGFPGGGDPVLSRNGGYS